MPILDRRKAPVHEGRPAPIFVRPRPGPSDPARDPPARHPGSARARVLRLMASVNGRPVTGGEILAYALTTWPAAEVKALMDGLAADGLVIFTEKNHPNARGRRTRSYRLAGPAADGTPPVAPDRGRIPRPGTRGEGGAA